ncbi:hypothetical protein Tco_1361156 [Tanacetum coccineum]
MGVRRSREMAVEEFRELMSMGGVHRLDDLTPRLNEESDLARRGGAGTVIGGGEGEDEDEFTGGCTTAREDLGDGREERGEDKRREDEKKRFEVRGESENWMGSDDVRVRELTCRRRTGARDVWRGGEISEDGENKDNLKGGLDDLDTPEEMEPRRIGPEWGEREREGKKRESRDEVIERVRRGSRGKESEMERERVPRREITRGEEIGECRGESRRRGVEEAHLGEEDEDREDRPDVSWDELHREREEDVIETREREGEASRKWRDVISELGIKSKIQRKTVNLRAKHGHENLKSTKEAKEQSDCQYKVQASVKSSPKEKPNSLVTKFCKAKGTTTMSIERNATLAILNCATNFDQRPQLDQMNWGNGIVRRLIGLESKAKRALESSQKGL